MRARSTWCGVGLLIGLVGLAGAQGVTSPSPRRPEIIRGRVVGDSGRALAGVAVIATMAPDRTFKQSVTDSAGRYEIRFDAGTGDYLIYAAPTGYRAFRRRITLGQTPEFTVDIRLQSEAVLLSSVRVTAQKPRPLPDLGMVRDPTAATSNTLGVVGGLSPELAGSLDALAATTPGITTTPDGQLIAFGMPGQVQYNYNGTTLSTTDLPRDARMSVRVITSAYDPSIGGFSGASINVEMGQGLRVSERFGRATFDAPALQVADRTSERLGNRFTAGELNADADGPIPSHDAYYNTGIKIRRTSRGSSSLFDATPDVLSLVGVQRDSVARLGSVASRLGLPLRARGAPDAFYSDGATFIARLDRFKDPAKYGKLWSNLFSLTTLGSYSGSGSVGGTPVTAATIGRDSKALKGQAIATFVHMNESYSTSVTSNLGGSHSSGSPYLFAPSAVVRVQSLNDATVTDRPVTLGGTEAPANSSSSALWETTSETNFYVAARHKMKVVGRVQVSASRNNPGGDPLGTFTFNSLADFDANRPASFSRTLAGEAVSANVVNGAFSVGDLWQVGPFFQLQPGIRLEANRYGSRPELNPALMPAFGISNTSVPNTVHASPRLGFAWQYRPVRGNLTTGSATTGRIYLPPRATLTGGIGEFRQTYLADRVMPALSGTGLGRSGQRLTCVGDATPTPDWNEFVDDPSSVPFACAGGAPTVFADTVPSVTLFDPHYDFPRSWRGNLRFGGTLGRIPYSIDGAYSYNSNQPGARDLNFRGEPGFTLPDEGNRPVFVAPTNVVPSTGVISLNGSRTSAGFGRVTELVSDLHSTARQITLNVTPELDRAVLSIAYTLSDVTTWARGFDETTFDNPDRIERSRSAIVPRHQINVTMARQIGAFGLSGSWRIRSGLPYTPIVGGDVNADGLANDRAFVFDPANAADRALGTELSNFISDAPSRVRDCLEPQIGHPAGRNSCIGPWTSTMNAALSTGYLHVLDGRYLVGAISFSNLLGGIDELFHGNNLHGWGTSPRPDPILYTVRGFDASNNRFQYALNPRFGSTSPSQSVLRAPFRMTLDIQLELGVPIRKQQFERFLQMDALRGNQARAPADSLRERLLDNRVVDVYDYVVRMRDSLLLNRDQVDSLQRLRAEYLPRAEAVWRELANDIYARSTAGSADVNDFARRVDELTRRGWAIVRDELPKIRALMTPGQLEVADVMLKFAVDSDKRIPPRPVLF